MNDPESMDAEGQSLDEQIDYHLKCKQALQAELGTLYRRIRYREEAVQKLAAKKKEALNFKLPLGV